MSWSKYFVLVLDLNTINKNQENPKPFFDGYLVSADGIQISCDTDVEIDSGVLADATGEFLFINSTTDEHGSKKFEISTDLFGFYNGFYFYKEDKLVVSNSFKALRKYLESEGAQLTLNIEYLVPLMISTHGIFNYPYALETALQEIKIVPSSKTLIFNTAGLTFIDRMIVPAETSYDEHLQKGLRSATKKLHALRNQFKDNFKKIFMSGGKDSRATLSLLLSVFSNRDFFVHSSNPATTRKGIGSHLQKDLIIANKIALLLGLKVCKKEPALPIKKTPDTFSESLSGWQNGFSNVRFNFQPTFYTYEYFGKDYKIQFRGAGGEIFRTYWSESFKRYESMYKRLQNKKATVKQDAELVFKTFISSKVVSEEIYAKAKALFCEVLSELPGDYFLQKIDQHYNFYRNRFHFGHGIRGLRVGELIYYPLIEKEFYLASLKLTDDEKESGKMVFDIVDRLYPYLNLIEYDSSRWSDQILSGSVNLKKTKYLDLPDFEGGSDHKPSLLLSDYKSNLNVESEELIRQLPSINYDRIEKMKERIEENLRYLGAHPDAKIIFNDTLTSLYKVRLEKNASINISLGKTESVRDALDSIEIDFDVLNVM